VPLPADTSDPLSALLRAASDVVTREELDKRLLASEKDGKPLRVKFGIDPTFTDIHVGHAVPIRMLRSFQEMGHLPVLILGDATARLGDPTGRNEQRPPLTKEEVEVNASTYLEQIGAILDLEEGKCEIRRNSEWFGEMDFFDGLRLASRATVARMLERDDFQKRVKEHLPIHIHELMYPVMQGWDSVQVEADIEIGGNDQLFNLHMGRLLQERAGQKAQICLTTHLLLGTDGQKMSKTCGNHIALRSSPEEVFGKVMSLSDEAMEAWFQLLTSQTEEETSAILSGHPRDAKDRLAREVTGWLHGEVEADAASQAFSKRFKDGELPEEIPEARLPAGSQALPGFLKTAGLASSTSEARRWIEQGGVRLDGEVCQDVRLEVDLSQHPEGLLIQVGKRKVLRTFLKA